MRHNNNNNTLISKRLFNTEPYEISSVRFVYKKTNLS